jgi:hypothetical protein
VKRSLSANYPLQQQKRFPDESPMTAANPPITSLVLSTAVIAASISALVSVITAVWSGWRERAARRKELLLTLSVQISIAVIESHMETIKLSGESRELYPTIVLARWHHRQLKLLFKTDRLDDDLENRFGDVINKPHDTL